MKKNSMKKLSHTIVEIPPDNIINAPNRAVKYALEYFGF